MLLSGVLSVAVQDFRVDKDDLDEALSKTNWRSSMCKGVDYWARLSWLSSKGGKSQNWNYLQPTISSARRQKMNQNPPLSTHWNYLQPTISSARKQKWIKILLSRQRSSFFIGRTNALVLSLPLLELFVVHDKIFQKIKFFPYKVVAPLGGSSSQWTTS